MLNTNMTQFLYDPCYFQSWDISLGHLKIIIFHFFPVPLLSKEVVDVYRSGYTSCLYNMFVLRFYGPVNPMGSCRAWSVYLTTHLLGRLSPLSG